MLESNHIVLFTLLSRATCMQTFFSLPGMLRFGVLKSTWTSYRKGFSGNLKGDGTILGSTLVIGPGDQGILFEYRSAEFGDHADPEDVLSAAKKISASR